MDVTVNFAHYEARAKALAKAGDFETAGLLLQAVEVMRELGARLAPATPDGAAPEPAAEAQGA